MPASESAVLLALFAYMALGAIIFRIWRRRRMRHPVDLHANFAAWLAFTLPLLIGADAFALAGAEICWLLVAQLTPILRDAYASYIVAGAVGFLIGFAILFVVIDVFFFVLPARRVQRQLRASDR